MTTTAEQTSTAYIFTVAEGNQVFAYEWGKQPPIGQTTEQYLQSCKREAEALVVDEISRQQPPTPVAI